jgi:hypothetical protein
MSGNGGAAEFSGTAVIGISPVVQELIELGMLLVVTG